MTRSTIFWNLWVKGIQTANGLSKLVDILEEAMAEESTYER